MSLDTTESLDTTKSAEPDKFDPYFLKIAADLITEPITYLFKEINYTSYLIFGNQQLSALY